MYLTKEQVSCAMTPPTNFMHGLAHCHGKPGLAHDKCTVHQVHMHSGMFRSYDKSAHGTQ
jgi:hypothetical protein